MTYTTLISATDLRTHAGDANWLLVDCRHDLTDPEAGRNAYLAGHIPQARFAHLDLILSGAKTDAGGKFLGRHPLPQRPALIAALRELGINDHTQVIAYDAHGGMFAARLWWLLRWLGHAEVAVLDGGIAAWQAAGGTLTDAVTAPATPGTLTESTALVGTVDQVVEAYLRYYDLGAHAIYLRGWDIAADAEQYGRQLIPALRAATQDRGI